ncbi:MAG: preprotein translocase subunit SecE [Candidatus Harrisonbacteria bacterium RIFCSPLOWO2_01_FULL_40_28]|uniref:Protein translocase subunit SecE n=2 Tax=Candidatus Harrisoniibacteriota TaxID=1817905 RepID=A0A1G1ZZ64_9BACT|nr:MAG: preprotein translocase subunit SecE [Candidatus Harrisonbacteria bacterium RIFCSPLOWO2_01_FULL_40_28]OGY69872.1 MAG: preprotein translocase subunit SecE [Candidatus Harrisonbacteria bacterium RIFOXYD1_FULL_40_9]
MLERIKVFFQESRRELEQVNWPSKSETVRLTSTVIIVSLLVALVLGFFDTLFRYLINIFLV